MGLSRNLHYVSVDIELLAIGLDANYEALQLRAKIPIRNMASMFTST